MTICLALTVRVSFLGSRIWEAARRGHCPTFPVPGASLPGSSPAPGLCHGSLTPLLQAVYLFPAKAGAELQRRNLCHRSPLCCPPGLGHQVQLKGRDVSDFPADCPTHPTSRRDTRHSGEQTRNPRGVKSFVNLSHSSLLTSSHPPIPLTPCTCSPGRSSFTFCCLGCLLWSWERSGAGWGTPGTAQPRPLPCARRRRRRWCRR